MEAPHLIFRNSGHGTLCSIFLGHCLLNTQFVNSNLFFKNQQTACQEVLDESFGEQSLKKAANTANAIVLTVESRSHPISWNYFKCLCHSLELNIYTKIVVSEVDLWHLIGAFDSAPACLCRTCVFSQLRNAQNHLFLSESAMRHETFISCGSTRTMPLLQLIIDEKEQHVIRACRETDRDESTSSTCGICFICSDNHWCKKGTIFN